MTEYSSETGSASAPAPISAPQPAKAKSQHIQELHVGVNYHPHDSGPDQWKKDVDLMKAAGFNVVRMGHLAWDSYEPEDGCFSFAWFDTVMDLMGKAGIKVVLDIAVRPAPLWLHRKFPSIDIVDTNGNKLYPNHRYMEDIGDPFYQEYALRFAKALAKRYGTHPALLAFGIDNESGDGRISYSETVRARFILWLKKKYADLASLNKAWAGQRWSRRIGDWEEIGLPVSGPVQGPPERVLDFRLFLSDEINAFLFKFLDTVKSEAPEALVTTNAWYYSPSKYFDYSAIAYSNKMTRHGCGFYPGNSLVNDQGIMGALFGIARIQFESVNPFWCVEFTTHDAVPGSIRKSAYASLMLGTQMVCGWTWQSMYGGEEQYLQGMVDWDGVPNRKYGEYKRLAAEFATIGKYFPYKASAEVGLAFSFSSQIASAAHPEQHDSQLQDCFERFCRRNIDTRIVEISRSALDYKLFVMPGIAVVDETVSERIRDFVKKGGTVIMTGFSALVGGSGTVLACAHPGRLDDVFGIRVGHSEDTELINEISRKSFKGRKLCVACQGREFILESSRFEVIELAGAEATGYLTSLDKDYPIITSCRYGQGTAIYAGLTANSGILDVFLDELIRKLSLRNGPEVPESVLARRIDNNHILYLNMSGEPKEIRINGRARSILLNKNYTDRFTIKPFEPDFIEIHPGS